MWCLFLIGKKSGCILRHDSFYSWNFHYMKMKCSVFFQAQFYNVLVIDDSFRFKSPQKSRRFIKLLNDSIETACDLILYCRAGCLNSSFFCINQTVQQPVEHNYGRHLSAALISVRNKLIFFSYEVVFFAKFNNQTHVIMFLLYMKCVSSRLRTFYYAPHSNSNGNF